MERGSTKHGPQLDEELKRETEGIVHAHRATHVEEWKQSEPAGEDQPRGPALVGGTPHGLTQGEVEARSELARYLGRDVFPALGALLVEVAEVNGAPDPVVARLRALEPQRLFENVAEVWEELGGGTEERP